jgi:hypothetical protein
LRLAEMDDAIVCPHGVSHGTGRFTAGLAIHKHKTGIHHLAQVWCLCESGAP